MKTTRRHALLFAVLLVPMTTAVFADTEGKAPAGIHWAKSFEEALALAKKSDRPVMVDFEAEWCGWCKKLDRDTYGHEQVIRLVNEYFVAVKVDTDAHPDIKDKYKVSGLPTIVIVSPNGDELQRLRGYRPPERFLEEIKKAVQSSTSLKELKATAKEEPDNLEAQRALARALFAGGNAKEAEETLARAMEKAPDHAGLLLDLADFQRARGQLKAARETYTKILALPAEKVGENREKVYLPLTRLLVRSSEYDEVVKLVGSFVDSYPKSEDRLEAHFLRAFAFARLKNAAGALAELQAVQKVAPDSNYGIRAADILDLVESAKPRKD